MNGRAGEAPAIRRTRQKDSRMNWTAPLRTARLAGITRRHFLRDCGSGLGALALSQLMTGGAQAAPAADHQIENPLRPKLPPQFGKAKRVIFLHLSGGPPHLDLFDYKPELQKHAGEPCPDSMIKGKRF